MHFVNVKMPLISVHVVLQVKEACEKALYKEEEARARLTQMNEDLSIHCRSMVRIQISNCDLFYSSIISWPGNMSKWLFFIIVKTGRVGLKC